MAIMKMGRVFRTCGEIKGGTLEVVVSMFTSRWWAGLWQKVLGERTVVMRGLVGAPVVPRHLWVGG